MPKFKTNRGVVVETSETAAAFAGYTPVEESKATEGDKPAKKTAAKKSSSSKTSK